MAALGSQQWYIEEIPAKEKDEESGDAACGREKDSEGGDSAPRAFISLDMDAAVRLDTPQSKVWRTAVNKWNICRESRVIMLLLQNLPAYRSLPGCRVFHLQHPFFPEIVHVRLLPSLVLELCLQRCAIARGLLLWQHVLMRGCFIMRLIRVDLKTYLKSLAGVVGGWVVGRRKETRRTPVAKRRREVTRTGRGQLLEPGLARQSQQVLRHSRHILEEGVHGRRLK